MQGFPASLYSKPTDRRRPAERPVVLVTDRPNPKSAISDALQVIAAVEVVGPDETWDRPGAIAGVVCDLTLARPQAAHCLRRLQARYAGVEPPLDAALLLWVKKVEIEVPRSGQSFAEQHACTCLRDVANYAGIRSSRTRKMGLPTQAGVLTLEFSFFAHQLVPSYLAVPHT